MGAAAVASFLHYITVGPNEVPEQAEEEAVAAEREQQQTRVERTTI